MMLPFLRASQSKPPRARRTRHCRPLAVERLEARRVLASVATTTPAIAGTVFSDDNGDGQPTSGEGIEDVQLELWVDDGDGMFDEAVDSLDSSTLTDSSGEYCFDNLDPDAAYFVLQDDQIVNGTAITRKTSGRLLPGVPSLLIDGFETLQDATASPPAPSSGDSIVSFSDDSEVIGRERDIVATLESGDGEVEVSVNPFGNRPTLRYNSDVAVTGSGTIVWDGIDGDATNLALGLAGEDLTRQGTLNGILLRMGALVSGAEADVRLYEGSGANFSEATLSIPTTSGGAADSYEFIPFSSFSGPVSANDVDAIELMIDANSSSANNIEVALIGVNGPKVANFSNVPETDLQITKTNDQTISIPGQTIRYVVEVMNNGPSDVTGASIVDNLPAELNTVTYTSGVVGNASGNTASGSGNIDDSVFMAAGSSIIYTIHGSLNHDATGSLVNTATVSVPTGIVDPVPSNNSATDTDTIQPEADLAITKDNARTSVVPGQAVTYTIVVNNRGPSFVVDATVVDSFPSELTGVTYTSTTSGMVVGNTDGSGNLNDTVSMSPGSSITYTVDATVAASAGGTLSNTATVNVPTGTIDPDLSDNSDTDADPITPEVDLAITKTDGMTNVNPGDVVTYTIVVSNDGPSSAMGATVADVFPSSLTNVSYTSSGTSGVTGNTTSGTGNINDTLTLPANSSLTYLATATVASSTSGSVQNTATVTTPQGSTDTSTGNDSATDTDVVDALFDLSITKTDNRSTVVAGQDTTYTVEVRNSGPSDVPSAAVTDDFPSQVANVSFTSSASGGATGNTTSGTGNISDSLNLPSGSQVTYVATGTVRSDASGSISNTAVVEDLAGDAIAGNNSATDTTDIAIEADLSISKTDDLDEVPQGDPLTYDIVVRNDGPSDVQGATVVDNLPSLLTNASYTSQASGGASGNTNGNGNINDVVNLPVGSSITYVVQAIVDENGVGTITNTAAVNAPSGVTETDPSDNSDTDTTSIDVVLRDISGFVYVDSDDDGIRDPGEPPLIGVEVFLTGTDNQNNDINRDTVTGRNGAYRFSDLNPGTYTIRMTQPDAFPDGQETIGQGAVSDPVVFDNVFQDLVLGRQQDATNFNFGELRPTLSKRAYLASSFD